MYKALGISEERADEIIVELADKTREANVGVELSSYENIVKGLDGYAPEEVSFICFLLGTQIAGHRIIENPGILTHLC